MDPLKVLYIEDDIVDQIAFERYIRKEKVNYHFELASSVSDASKKIGQKKYDVIVTDYLLKDGNGLALLDSITNTPTIVITGQGDEQIAVKALKKGAYDYIVKEPSGNYLELLVTAIDKAYQYHSAKERLSEAEIEIKNLLELLSQTDNAIVVLNIRGQVEWLNYGFEKIYGVRFHEIKLKSIHDIRVSISSEPNEKNILERIQDVIMSGKSQVFESKIVLNNGEEIFTHSILKPILNEDNGLTEKLILVDTNITEKKKIEKELISSKEKAEQAALTKQQFLANMSHEIRTPLNAITGLVQMLKDTTLNNTQSRYLQLIQGASDNLLNIINDILDISKIEANKISIYESVINLRALGEQLFNSLHYRSEEKGLEMTCSFDPKLPLYVKGDALRINQILMNLIGNAIKFTEFGKVELKIRCETCGKDNANIIFEIRDTGIGIPKDANEKIFEYFQQVHNDSSRRYGGTGLGLAIVKRLVDLMHGEVWFESEEKKGSVFYVRIPFQVPHQNETGEKTKITKAVLPSELKNTRVLLVEDNELNQTVARYMLEKMGMLVSVASNGKIAIDMMKHENFDLVIMDIQMPEMDGYQTTSYIRNEFDKPKSKVPILAMTAHAFKEEEIKCIQAGMDEYIPKPINSALLQSKISALISASPAASLETEQEQA
jgi:PAS domain S-box-containing protein